MSIGCRSQSARTYLERHLNEFIDCDLQELIIHGLRALRDTLPNDVTLSKDNVSIAYVSKGEKFTVLEPQTNDVYLNLLGEDPKHERRAAEEAGDAKPAEGAAPSDGSMQVD